ncbi:MAG: IS30 family transposase [Dermatophilaceae bacterium]
MTRPAKHPLRSNRRRRRRRTQGLEQRGPPDCDDDDRPAPSAQRPAPSEDREEAGHWELIKGSGNQSAIGTWLEGQVRFVMLVHLPGTQRPVRHGVTDAFTQLPESLRGTLTWDKGKEMAGNQQIVSASGLNVYFCDAHSPWQRGSNENMNDIVRQYFPKGTDLRAYTAEDVAIVADEIRACPANVWGGAR